MTALDVIGYFGCVVVFLLLCWGISEANYVMKRRRIFEEAVEQWVERWPQLEVVSITWHGRNAEEVTVLIAKTREEGLGDAA